MSHSQDDDGSRKSFSFQFDLSFQEKIIQAMVTDRPWAAQISEVIDVEFFEFAHLRLLSSKFLDYYRKYKEFPSVEILINIVKGEVRHDDQLKQQVIQVIANIKNKKDLGDLGYVKEKAMSFCRQQSFKKALIDCTELIASEDQYDHAIEIIKRSISAGQVQSPGISLGNEDDIDARYSETYRNTVRTNIQTLSGDSSLDDRKILNGGLGSGEIGVCIASTGVFKSHLLVHVGSQALLQGKNVLHVTCELNERAVGIRYDSHLLGIDSLDCRDHKDEVKKFYQENASCLGRLQIKYFQTGTATINTLRTFIDKLTFQNFRPDFLIVDYAGIMRSTEKYELPRLELKKIYEELRGFAGEFDIPLWTACQSNKEGAEADIISLANMAEAYAQAHICDFVIGIGRPESQKATGLGTLFVAKNRAGVDGISFKVRLNTAQSRIHILSEDDVKTLSAEETKRQEDEMNIVRRTYRELNAKKLMGKDTPVVVEKLKGTKSKPDPEGGNGGSSST